MTVGALGGYERDSNQLNIINDLGHAIGLHGYSHNQLWNVFSDAVIQDGLNMQVDILTGLGIQPAKLLRAPGGHFSEDEVVTSFEDWYYYGWTVDSCDNDTQPGCIDVPDSENYNSEDANKVITNVLNTLEAQGYPDNPIILLHSINGATAYSIIMMPEGEDLISRLKNVGYTRFRKLPRPGDPTGTVIDF